jgi:hypothetical protein
MIVMTPSSAILIYIIYKIEISMTQAIILFNEFL